MSGSDVSELSEHRRRSSSSPARSPVGNATSAHFPPAARRGVPDAAEIDEIDIDPTGRPSVVREAAAASSSRRQSMAAYDLFPSHSGGAGAQGFARSGGDLERHLSGVVTCHMARRDLQRLLARARAERNQDLYDCYFHDHVVVDSPDAVTTGAEGILCRACGCAIAAHGDSPIDPSSAEHVGLGSLSRPPRRPAALNSRNELTTGYARPPLVAALLLVLTAAVATVFLVVPGATGAGSGPLAVVVPVALLLSLVSCALSTRTTIEFDTDVRVVRRVRSRALFRCGCVDAIAEWSFRDIAGIVASPDGPRAKDADGRSHSLGLASRFVSYSVVLELYSPDGGGQGRRRPAGTTKNPLTVQPGGDDGELDHASSGADDDTTQATAPTDTILLQRRVPPRDIAQTEADWLFFVNSLTDPM
uniref:Uncharacterized protein n=1 Tax=Neobodo designis TaxID=312471 RepID=A0A7S1PRK3_NEODS